MSADLVQIPKDRIRDVWPIVANWIEGVASRSGIWTVRGMVSRLESGESQLWLIWDDEAECALAAFGSRLFTGDNGRKFAEITWLTGKEMKRWRHLHDKFEEWAKAEGCYGVRHWARPGWERASGVDFKKTHVMLERVL